VLAGRNLGGRDAADCVIRTDLDTSANLIHSEPLYTTCSMAPQSSLAQRNLSGSGEIRRRRGQTLVDIKEQPAAESGELTADVTSGGAVS
jgi:hypothetical protein